MHHRIQGLMTQAVTFRLDPDSERYEAQVSPEDLELFAELIVRECIDAVENTSDRYRKDYFADKIRERFSIDQ